VATLVRGGAFGEIALMYSCPRTATVRTKTAAVLWVLDRKTFRRILMQESIRRRELYQTFLAKVSLLKGLFPYERAKIADSLEPIYFNKGDVVIRQGQTEADKFYIIEKGEVEVTKADATGKNAVFAMSLGVGGYFGELALLRNEPRAATVSAKTDVKLLAISREHFSQVLAPCEEILKRHTQDYKSYSELLTRSSPAAFSMADAGTEDDEVHSDFPKERAAMIKYMSEDEADFVMTLQQLDGYRRALLEHAKAIGLAPDKIQLTFARLSEVQTTHEELSKALKEAVAKGAEARVNDAYTAFVAHLSTYEAFLAGYEAAQKAVDELHTTPDVATFLQACEKQAGSSLGSYLADVKDRLAEIAAQLAHLAEISTEHHPDSSDLSIAQRKIQAIAPN